ncbi:MAG: BadF/BadG/BcrA/BcrD ATPase family protein [Halioglobus sp.]
MALKHADDETLFIGVDGGGSKCRATIANDRGVILGTGVAGPANPFQDTRQAQDSIVASAKLALDDAALPPDILTELVAGVGLAGVNLPRFFDIIDNWEHPFRQLFLATDLHIACMGAHGGEDGAVMVAGTGSCGYYHSPDESYILGAHGFPFGDKGSGAWLGLEAVKAILLADDGFGPVTALQQSICQQMQTDTLGVIEHLSGANSNHYAKLAPLVFTAANENDPVAQAILEEGVAYLSAVAERLCAAGPARISFLGGMGKYIIPRLPPDIAKRFSPPLHEPDHGAIFYARQQWQIQNEAQAPISLPADLLAPSP